MSSRLAGIEAKVGRAQMHLEEFKRLSRGYADSRPYAIREEDNLNHEGFMQRSYFIDHVQAMPTGLPLVMGDCVQNLRAALDHLAWQLVLAAGNTPTDRTAFPIFDSRFNEKGNPRNLFIARGVGPKALAIIESSQPYHRGNDPERHPLSILHDLSNIDKHRTVLLVVGAYDSYVSVDIPYGGWRSPSRLVEIGESRLLSKGTRILGTFIVGNSDPLPETEGQLQLSLQVQFGQGERCEGQVVANTLQQFLHTIRDIIIPSFKGFLI